jgi:hypothetical protein
MIHFILVFMFLLIYLYYRYNEYVLVNLYFMLIIKRGIIVPSRFWWGVNDNIMGRHGLSDFYFGMKRKYNNNPLIPIKVMTTPLLMMTDIDSIKYMLDRSPGDFGPGKFKLSFFEHFMNNNVGISIGENWKIRRQFNEAILAIGNPIHGNNTFMNSMINIINDECKKLTTDKNQLDILSFSKFSKNTTSRIIFGRIDPNVYNMFKGSSDLYGLAFPSVDPPNDRILEYMKTPTEEYCMMDMLRSYNNKNPDIDMYHQIPHWIFPTNGSLSILLLKLVYFINAHSQSRENTNELFNNPFDLTKLVTHTYLEWIILECLRINNPVVTFFREVLTDNTYTSLKGNIVEFKAGQQLFVLTSPIIRDPEIFPEPSKFNPDRWQNSELQRYNLMFGIGKQICPGQDIIKTILKICLWNLFHYNRFEISPECIDINNVEDMINPYSICIKIFNII